jgi:hypothetical protein
VLTYCVFARYPELIELANTNYGGVAEMAKKWAKVIRTKANNERAVQVRYIKKIWLANGSQFALATNLLESDLAANDAEVEISMDLRNTGLTSIAHVRDCLKSNSMCANPVMYKLFCAGLESGQLKGGTRRDPCSLRLLVTIAHEAHIRQELYFALKTQRYRHPVTHEWSELRKKSWGEFCLLVKQDRQNNELQAFENRCANMNLLDTAFDHSSNDDDDDVVNPDFY